MIRIKYFATFREQAGKQEEEIDFEAISLSELYIRLKETYQFTLNLDQMQFAVNAVYRNPNYVAVDGDEVVFIPPVAGG